MHRNAGGLGVSQSSTRMLVDKEFADQVWEAWDKGEIVAAGQFLSSLFIACLDAPSSAKNDRQEGLHGIKKHRVTVRQVI